MAQFQDITMVEMNSIPARENRHTKNIIEFDLKSYRLLIRIDMIGIDFFNVKNKENTKFDILLKENDYFKKLLQRKALELDNLPQERVELPS